MSQFSIEINDEMCEEVWDAFAFRFDYEGRKIGDETKQDFTRRIVINWIKEQVIQGQVGMAEKAAGDSKEESISASLTIE